MCENDFNHSLFELEQASFDYMLELLELILHKSINNFISLHPINFPEMIYLILNVYLSLYHP